MLHREGNTEEEVNYTVTIILHTVCKQGQVKHSIVLQPVFNQSGLVTWERTWHRRHKHTLWPTNLSLVGTQGTSRV